MSSILNDIYLYKLDLCNKFSIDYSFNWNNIQSICDVKCDDYYINFKYFLSTSEKSKMLMENKLNELEKFKENLNKFGFTGNLEKIIDISNINLSDVKYDSSDGVFNKLTVYYNELFDYISQQNTQIYITISKTVIKLRDISNNRICKISPKNVDQMLGLINLYEKFSDRFIFSKIRSPGILYEEKKVQELNSYFKNLIKPKKLYISDSSESFIDSEIYVDGAKKIDGVGKADIALMNGDKEVFWISYKHSPFFKSKENKELSSVGFQQYGSLQTLYDQSKTKDEIPCYSEFKNIIDGFLIKIKDIMIPECIKNVTDINIDNKNHLITLIVDGCPMVFSATKNKDFPKSIVDREKFDSLFLKRKTILKVINNNKSVDILFFKQGTNYCYDYTRIGDKKGLFSNKINMKNMVSKSIYGNEFTINNKIFGRENVNILIQSDQNFKLNSFTVIEKDDSVLLDIGNNGHIICNPIFINEELESITGALDKYSPILLFRYTKTESFVFDNFDKSTIYIGGRLLVVPKEKANSAKELIEIF